MKEFENFNDVLDFAIESEQDAADFYNDLAKSVKGSGIRESFLDFAKEEMNHKKRLEYIKEKGFTEQKVGKVQDLKISDYLVDMTLREDMTYKDALILAMKREKSAYNLYTKLSANTDNADLKKIFTSLAIDEAKHKLRFEIEYDEYVYREN
ncbi:ferritin family protein [Bacteroidota bacterium]